MRVVFVGCGYVAPFYVRSLRSYPAIELIGVYDAIQAHSGEFCARYRTRQYATLEEVLDDERVDAIINLTNPGSHYEVSRRALLAGKHVYTEKPLATKLAEAQELVDIARRQGLQISAAPCNVLSEAAQTVWQALREGLIGQPRLVYAEMDDGMVHRLPYQNWKNDVGRAWPYVDEFSVGCTLEHAGYYVSWLIAFFGPVRQLTTFSRCVIDDKQTDRPVPEMAPDFSVACLEFASGTIARLTCSIIAPHDHRLKIVGEDGTLTVNDCWFYRTPVHYQPFSTLSTRWRSLPIVSRLLGVHRRKLPLAKHHATPSQLGGGAHAMDFARGIAELACAVQEQRDSRLSAQFSLHVNEVVLRIQHPCGTEVQQMSTSTTGMDPMPWANSTARSFQSAAVRGARWHPSHNGNVARHGYRIEKPPGPAPSNSSNGFETAGS